ncbi:hypothetical protein Mapa_005718 [Marchantia paleacea]|nr:hypothetical protein Mapa_005718 [Marchantia paleacea]
MNRSPKHGQIVSTPNPVPENCCEKNKFVVILALLMAAAIVIFFNSASRFTDVELKDMENQNSGTHHVTTFNYSNILVDESSNYTSTLQTLLQLNGTTPCHNVTTNFTRLENLPAPVRGKIKLRTNIKHVLILVAYSEDGMKRCAGGDYFEVDLHNEHYRSRLPTMDYGNGTYGLELLVPSRWSGVFDLEISILFSNWHGMDLICKECPEPHVVLQQEIHLFEPSDEHFFSSELDEESKKVKPLKNLTRCTTEDFYRATWSGRWTRSWFNDVCEPDEQKRFKCLPDKHYQCEEPWCFGPVGRLESNGWQYSAHCSFKIFARDEAWSCLDRRWWLIWGDSNFQDTIRNIALFILDWKIPGTKATINDFTLDRTYERLFINPNCLEQGFRASMMFNGANDDRFNGEGLHTIMHKDHQERIKSHFTGKYWAPDTIIMNSGLHDGTHNLKSFLEQVDYTVDWWKNFYKNITAERKPKLIWRNTVTPAGTARQKPGNPTKLETYNLLMVEKLLQVRDELPVMFVDTFDLTFPWHYTNEYSDGGHYGRPPGMRGRPAKPHHYFVDLMNAHIWLNALCPASDA